MNKSGFALILVLLFNKTYGHSWLHCLDYDNKASLKVGAIQNNLCKKYPRGITDSVVFGNDVGFDYIPKSDIACKFGPGSLVPMVKNTKYRLIWPAKNHRADTCTNPYIPDNQLKLFLIPGKITDKDPLLSTWSKSEFLINDFKANGGPGFQNCPDFCTNTDKAPCFGDFQFPATLVNGQYKALWMW